MAFADTSTRHLLEAMLPVKITLAEACDTGDPLGYSTGWKRADANNSIYMELIAGEAGAIGDVITAYRLAVVEGFTGGTDGGALYLSDTAGKYGSSAGSVSQVCGQMISETAAFLFPHPIGSYTDSDLAANAAIAFSKLASLPSARILVGNASNVPTAVAVTGDITITNAGVTAIGAAKVLQSMLHANQRIRIVRGQTWDIDVGAGTYDEVILRPAEAMTLIAARIVYEDVQSGACTDASVALGTAAGGTQIATAVNLEASKAVGTITEVEMQSTALPADTPLCARWTLLAATVAGKCHLEVEYKIDDPA
jgi:hypothetical protein